MLQYSILFVVTVTHTFIKNKINTAFTQFIKFKNIYQRPQQFSMHKPLTVLDNMKFNTQTVKFVNFFKNVFYNDCLVA